MAMKARKSGKAAAPPMKARTMNVMKAMKSGKAAAPPIKARTMKAMKSGNAAAPPMKAPTMKVLKAMKVDLKKAMKAKFLQKAMKATKARHRKGNVEVWTWCDTRNIPSVWCVSHWNGKQVEHEVYGKLATKHTMHVS